MTRAILHGTVELVVSPSSTEQVTFDQDEMLHIYIEDLSQVPNTENAEEHPKSSGLILLGETSIHLAGNHGFPLAFEFEYDPTKVSNGQDFDKLCQKGLIIVGAEVDADGRDMTTYWLKSGPEKFRQNIKLTLTDSYR